MRIQIYLWSYIIIINEYQILLYDILLHHNTIFYHCNYKDEVICIYVQILYNKIGLHYIYIYYDITTYIIYKHMQLIGTYDLFEKLVFVYLTKLIYRISIDVWHCIWICWTHYMADTLTMFPVEVIVLYNKGWTAMLSEI